MIESFFTNPTVPDNFFETLEFECAKAKYFQMDISLFFIKLCPEIDLITTCGMLRAKHIFKDIHNIIRQNVRHVDRVFYFGCDGFMLILPHTPKSHSNILIRKLSSLITNYSFTDDYGATHALSPKFGVSSYPQGKEDNA